MTLGFGTTRLEDKLDWCECMQQCNLDDNEIEDYCCENYENCEKYLKYKKMSYKAEVIT
jgi:hypothetical protein